jgi:hypothetical protein
VLQTLVDAYYLFPKGKLTNATPFVRAMPEEWKYDDTIDTFTAYKRYIASKPWVKDNYSGCPKENLTGFNLL